MIRIRRSRLRLRCSHMPTISLIAAVGPDGAIGRKGDLLLPISADLRYFKANTLGKVVVMGRKTYESIPTKFRPFPGRRNVVLTRDPNWKEEGVEVIHNFSEVLEIETDKEIMIAGGSEIYKLALPYANKLYLTEIRSFKLNGNYLSTSVSGVSNGILMKQFGDAIFPLYPKIPPEVWKQVFRVTVPDENVDAEWVIYEKR